jgi:hypothetical protein
MKADVDDRSKQKRERDRKARYRRRLHDGTIVVPLPVSHEFIAFLIDTRWLAENESEDRKKVLAAIIRMHDDVAKSHR